jgi:hypothetical protein
VDIAPARRDAHADISQQLAELLGATARAAGLIHHRPVQQRQP